MSRVSHMTVDFGRQEEKKDNKIQARCLSSIIECTFAHTGNNWISTAYL